VYTQRVHVPMPVLPRFSFHVFTIKVFLLDAHEVGVA
jgi:hypothetical protein